MLFRHLEFSRTSWWIALLIFLCANQNVHAAVFPYGNFSGPNVEYFNVTESPTKVPTPTGPPSWPYPLFNSPTLIGDFLDFNPSDFNAVSTGGSFPLTDSQLSMTLIDINPNYNFNTMVIQEGGSYSLIGGSANTRAIVSLNVVLAKILEVNGAPITPITVPAVVAYVNSGSANSTVVSNELIMDNSIVQPPLLNQLWQASAYFDFDAALTAADISGHATKIDLVLDNTLSATSEVVGNNNNPTTAYIDKKDFSIQMNGVDPVPEPSSIALVLLGGLGLTTFSLRSRRHRPALDSS